MYFTREATISGVTGAKEEHCTDIQNIYSYFISIVLFQMLPTLVVATLTDVKVNKKDVFSASIS
jgi:hypothetical protein